MKIPPRDFVVKDIIRREENKETVKHAAQSNVSRIMFVCTSKCDRETFIIRRLVLFNTKGL